MPHAYAYVSGSCSSLQIWCGSTINSGFSTESTYVLIWYEGYSLLENVAKTQTRKDWNPSHGTAGLCWNEILVTLALCSGTMKKTPIPQHTAFLKTPSNNVRPTLDLVKVSGKTKEVTRSWKRAGSFSRRLRRDRASVSQKEIPNSSICDGGFLYRSRTQDTTRALWRNLRIFTWCLFAWFFKQKYNT